MKRRYTQLAFTGLLTTSVIAVHSPLLAENGNQPIKCNDIIGELAYLGNSDDNSSSFWLSTYSGGGMDVEPFRLEPARQSSWFDSFTLSVSGTRSSVSPVVSQGSGGTHKLLAVNYGNNCVVDTQNQKETTPPEPPVEPPIEPPIEPPDPPDPPIDPEPPIEPPIDPPDPPIIEPPIDPPDPPDPPIEPEPPETKPPDPEQPDPTEPPETRPPEPEPQEPERPDGDKLIQELLDTLTQSLTTAALERGYSISDRIVTGLVGRSYLDRMSANSSPASFRQNLLSFLDEKQAMGEPGDFQEDMIQTSRPDVFNAVTVNLEIPVNPEPPMGPGREFGISSAYNLWADGQYFDIDDDRYDIDATGSIKEIRFGIDRLFGDDLVLGIAGGLEQLENTAYSGSIHIEQDGLFIGPYLGYRISEFAVIDMWLGYTKGDGESRISRLEGSFDADRLFISANISSQYTTENQFNFRPKFSFYYGKTEISDYSLYLDPSKNNGYGGTLTVDDYDANYGVAEFSIEANRIFDTSRDTYTMPFLRLGVSYAFERPNDGVIITPELTAEDTAEVLGNANIGFRMLINKQFVTEVRAGYYGIGESDLDVWDGRLVLSYFF